MKRLIILDSLLSFLFISIAQAEILIEPVLGYNFATKAEIKGPNGDKSKGSGSGVGYGGRIGFQAVGFQIGADYLHSSLSLDKDIDETVDTNELAAFVGYEFPVFLRVYAGYIFSATGEYKDGNSQKVKLSDGSGTKFGIGFTGLPIIDINLEYRSGEFDQYEVNGAKTDNKTSYNSLFLGLSAPFTF